MKNEEDNFVTPVIDDFETAKGALADKLEDMETPGFEAEFDPDEAENVGAFVEDALTEQEARESIIDLVDGEVE